MGVEKDQLTVQEAVAQEARLLGGSFSGSGRRRRARNNVRVSVSVSVDNRRRRSRRFSRRSRRHSFS
jgi:hypothetical protein